MTLSCSSTGLPSVTLDIRCVCVHVWGVTIKWIKHQNQINASVPVWGTRCLSPVIRTGHFLQICSLEEIENVPISFLHCTSQTPHRAAAVCCKDYYFTYVRAETCAGAPAARVECRHAHAGLDEATLQRANKWGFKGWVSHKPAALVFVVGVWKRCMKAIKGCSVSLTLATFSLEFYVASLHSRDFLPFFFLKTHKSHCGGKKRKSTTYFKSAKSDDTTAMASALFERKRLCGGGTAPIWPPDTVTIPASCREAQWVAPNELLCRY